MSESNLKKTKPLFFISHAHHDALIANWFKRKIINFFAKTVDVFVSSMPEDNQKGKKWFDETLIPKLQQCDIFISLMTPVSIKKHWMWFELGIVWSKTIKANIYPICLGVEASLIPMPLSELQATVLNREADEEMTALFKSWSDLLNGGGDFSKLRAKNSLIELYKNYDSLYNAPIIILDQKSQDIQTYQNNLENVLEILIDLGAITAPQLTSFRDYELLSNDKINSLRKIARQVAKQKDN